MAQAAQARNWRMWIPATAMMLSTLLSYIYRQTLAVLSPMILHDTGLSVAQYGDVGSAFSIAYMIANPLWGSMIDYIGLRKGMLIAVSVWTLASISHSWVNGFIGFAIARTLLGLGEGATFPGGLKTAMVSLPPNRQARGMALGYSGASLGALITPLIMTPIALHFGWRVAFLVTAAFGAAWLKLWLSISDAGLVPEGPKSKLRFQFPNLLERRLWLIVTTFGLGAVALGVVSNLSALYLNRVLGMTQAELGNVLWIPFVGWEVGYFFWGWVADRYVGADPGRTRLIFVLLTVLALPSAYVTQLHSWQTVMAVFFWAMFIADGFVVMSLRVGARDYPKDQTGLVAGIGSGSWAAVLAVVLPIYGRWFDRQWYEAVFVSMSLLPAAGTALWMLLSRNQVMNQEEIHASS